MKMYLISDNVDTLTGFQLTGTEGVVVHERDEFKNAVEKVKNDKEIGILLVTDKLAVDFKEELGELKSSAKLPLVVQIPDRHGGSKIKDSITSYVRDAIGVKI